MADDQHTTTRTAPAFQFYPKDFLSAESVQVMSLQERGAYITLICVCWIEGSLPADVARLARLCGAPLTAFRRFWPALERCFRADPEAPGRLIHPRLERERHKQAEFRRRQSDNGRRGGRPRKPDQSHEKPTQNPTKSQTKGLGFSGLTQTKAKKSSAICDLQTAVGVPRPAPLHTTHKSHAFCGVVCVPASAWDGMLRRMGGDEAKLRGWIERVEGDWRQRVERGEPVPEGDDFAFWRARWTESFGAEKRQPPSGGERYVESVEETEKLLAARRAWAQEAGK